MDKDKIDRILIPSKIDTLSNQTLPQEADINSIYRIVDSRKVNLTYIQNKVFKALANCMSINENYFYLEHYEFYLLGETDLLRKDLIKVINSLKRKHILEKTDHHGKICIWLNPKYAYFCDNWISFNVIRRNYALCSTYYPALPEYHCIDIMEKIQGMFGFDYTTGEKSKAA